MKHMDTQTNKCTLRFHYALRLQSVVNEDKLFVRFTLNIGIK
jgi:hypothetical protein